jgi:hypothetical protein
MPFPTDDNFSAFCFLAWAGLHTEFCGNLRTLTEHILSKWGIPWRWEGRSIRKSPYSSVIACAELFLLRFVLVWHSTFTKAPVRISTYIIFNNACYCFQVLCTSNTKPLPSQVKIKTQVELFRWKDLAFHLSGIY